MGTQSSTLHGGFDRRLLDFIEEDPGEDKILAYINVEDPDGTFDAKRKYADYKRGAWPSEDYLAARNPDLRRKRTQPSSTPTDMRLPCPNLNEIPKNAAHFDETLKFMLDTGYESEAAQYAVRNLAYNGRLRIQEWKASRSRRQVKSSSAGTPSLPPESGKSTPGSQFAQHSITLSDGARERLLTDLKPASFAVPMPSVLTRMSPEELAQVQAYYMRQPQNQQSGLADPSTVHSHFRLAESTEARDAREAEENRQARIQQQKLPEWDLLGEELRPVWKGNSDPQQRERFRDQRLLDENFGWYAGDLYARMPDSVRKGHENPSTGEELPIEDPENLPPYLEHPVLPSSRSLMAAAEEWEQEDHAKGMFLDACDEALELLRRLENMDVADGLKQQILAFGTPAPPKLEQPQSAGSKTQTKFSMPLVYHCHCLRGFTFRDELVDHVYTCESVWEDWGLKIPFPASSIEDPEHAFPQSAGAEMQWDRPFHYQPLPAGEPYPACVGAYGRYMTLNGEKPGPKSAYVFPLLHPSLPQQVIEWARKGAKASFYITPNAIPQQSIDITKDGQLLRYSNHPMPIYDARHFTNLLFSGTHLKMFMDLWDIRRSASQITETSRRRSDNPLLDPSSEDTLSMKMEKMRLASRNRPVRDIIQPGLIMDVGHEILTSSVTIHKTRSRHPVFRDLVAKRRKMNNGKMVWVTGSSTGEGIAPPMDAEAAVKNPAQLKQLYREVRAASEEASSLTYVPLRATFESKPQAISKPTSQELPRKRLALPHWKPRLAGVAEAEDITPDVRTAIEERQEYLRSENFQLRGPGFEIPNLIDYSHTGSGHFHVSETGTGFAFKFTQEEKPRDEEGNIIPYLTTMDLWRKIKWAADQGYQHSLGLAGDLSLIEFDATALDLKLNTAFFPPLTSRDSQAPYNVRMKKITVNKPARVAGRVAPKGTDIERKDLETQVLQRVDQQLKVFKNIHEAATRKVAAYNKVKDQLKKRKKNGNTSDKELEQYRSQIAEPDGFEAVIGEMGGREIKYTLQDFSQWASKLKQELHIVAEHHRHRLVLEIEAIDALKETVEQRIHYHLFILSEIKRMHTNGQTVPIQPWMVTEAFGDSHDCLCTACWDTYDDETKQVFWEQREGMSSEVADHREKGKREKSGWEDDSWAAWKATQRDMAAGVSGLLASHLAMCQQLGITSSMLADVQYFYLGPHFHVGWELLEDQIKGPTWYPTYHNKISSDRLYSCQAAHRTWGLMGGEEGLQREFELNPFADTWNSEGEDYYTPEQQAIFAEFRKPDSDVYTWPESARELVPSATRLRSQNGRLTNEEETRAPFIQVLLPEDTLWEKDPTFHSDATREEIEAAKHKLWTESLERVTKAQDESMEQNYTFEKDPNPNWRPDPKDITLWVQWLQQQDKEHKRPVKRLSEYEHEANELLRPVNFVLKEGTERYVACKGIPQREIERVNHHIEWLQLSMMFSDAARAVDPFCMRQWLPRLEYRWYKRPAGELARRDMEMRQEIVRDTGYDVSKVPHITSGNPLLMTTRSTRYGTITNAIQQAYETTADWFEYLSICAALRNRVTEQQMDTDKPDSAGDDTVMIM